MLLKKSSRTKAGRRIFSLSTMIVCCVLAYACIGAFARIMTSLNHNEHMYICAGVLTAQGQSLYRDFAYLQAPYLPMAYGIVFNMLKIDSFYLLTGKWISFLLLCMSATAIFWGARRVVRDINFALGVAALFMLNTTVIDPATEVSNYILPLGATLLAFYIFIVSFGSSIKPGGLVLAGLMLAAAAGAKLTYAPIIIPFIIITICCPVQKKSSPVCMRHRLAGAMFPLVAGMAIGLIPFFAFLYSDPARFLFNNLGYHHINAQWRLITGYEGPMALHARLAYAAEILSRTENLILVLPIMLGCGCAVNRLRKNKNTHEGISPGACLALLLLLTGLASAIAPAPSFPQYYALPVSCLFLLLLYTTPALSAIHPVLRRGFFLVLLLATLAYNGPPLHASIAKLPHRNRWAGLFVHDTAGFISHILRVKTPAAQGRIATLSPLFAVEANLPVYPELSTGPFLYRVGDLLAPADRSRFIGTSPMRLNDLLDREAPWAILVGFEGELDAPLIAYARKHGYRAVTVPAFKGTLYIRPGPG